MLQAFMLGMFLIGIAFLACDVWSLVAWKAGWRVTAGLIGAAYCLVVARIVVEISGNPYSHNMWPFEIVIWSAIGLGVLGFLAVFRVIVSASQALP
jgi:hypothetical protein